MKELTKEELLATNGGGFVTWFALTILIACIDNPDDFMQGLKDASN